jgi:hypothetical protein
MEMDATRKNGKMVMTNWRLALLLQQLLVRGLNGIKYKYKPMGIEFTRG